MTLERGHILAAYLIHKYISHGLTVLGVSVGTNLLKTYVDHLAAQNVF
jgi:hypothetical protein